MKKFQIYFILAIALLLRLVVIDQSFWLDEASQAMTSMRPLQEIIFHNLNDFHPPFSYILSHFWIQFGSNEVWLRLLPVLFGVGTVFLLYMLGKQLFNENVGLLGALLLAIAPYHIYYSQEFRMYSMAAFFAVWSMVCFVRIIKGIKGGVFGRVGFVLSSVLLLYTHYLSGALFLGQITYLYLFERKMVINFLGYYLGVGLLFLPWVPFFFTQLQLGLNADSVIPGWSTMLSLSFYKAIPLLIVKFTIGRIDFDNLFVYLSVISVSLLVVGFGFYPLFRKIRERNILLLLFWLLLPILFTFIISFKVPMFQPFRLLFVLPAFLLLLAIGILEFKKYQLFVLRSVVLLFLLLQGIFVFNPQYWREDWKGAVLVADEFVKNQGYVLFAWKEPFPPYQFYSRKQVGVGGLLPEIGEKFVTGEISGPVAYFSYLGQLTDPEKKTQELLVDYGYKEVEVKDFRGVGLLYLYAPREQTLGYR